MANTSNLSAINCKGRQINLLNEDKEDKKNVNITVLNVKKALLQGLYVVRKHE